MDDMWIFFHDSEGFIIGSTHKEEEEEMKMEEALDLRIIYQTTFSEYRAIMKSNREEENEI